MAGQKQDFDTSTPEGLIEAYTAKIAAIKNKTPMEGDRSEDISSFETLLAKAKQDVIDNKTKADADAAASFKAAQEKPTEQPPGTSSNPSDPNYVAAGNAAPPAPERALVNKSAKEKLEEFQGIMDRAANDSNSLIRSGSLGRVDANEVKTGRSVEMQDVIAMRKSALSGASAQEQQVQTEKANQEINRGVQTATRQQQTSQNASGTRGGTASMQQLQTIMQGQQAKANIQRDLFLDNQAQKRAALNSYEGALTGAEATEGQRQAAQMELQKFNIAQNAKERAAQLSTAMTTTGMVVGSLEAEKGFAAQIEAARLGGAGGGGNAGGGGFSAICTELHRQGIMPSDVYLVDSEFGNKLLVTQPDLVAGYHLFAIPLAKLMSKSKLLTKLLTPIGMAWANQMCGKINLLGFLLFVTGIPLCLLIGKIIKLIKFIKGKL